MYNYVFFLADNDYQRICYSELNDVPNAQIVFNWNLGRIMNFVHKVHMSPKINSIIRLPFKKIWYLKYFRPNFKERKPFCFVFDTCLIKIYSFEHYLSYLKKKYPDALFVLFYQDLISTFPECFAPEQTKKYFNLLISYDKNDARKYGLNYHPTVSTRISPRHIHHDDYKSDVYCLAQVKDRLPLFLEIYDKLTAERIKCNFYLLKVLPEKRVQRDGIVYLDSPMSYEENIAHVISTNCILEIMQKGAVGYTLRLWEAILYDKKLLTNNTSLCESEFYNSQYISVLHFNENGVAINKDFVKNKSIYINPYKNRVTPSNLMHYIDECIKDSTSNLNCG